MTLKLNTDLTETLEETPGDLRSLGKFMFYKVCQKIRTNPGIAFHGAPFATKPEAAEKTIDKVLKPLVQYIVEKDPTNCSRSRYFKLG